MAEYWKYINILKHKGQQLVYYLGYPDTTSCAVPYNDHIYVHLYTQNKIHGIRSIAYLFMVEDKINYIQILAIKGQ